MEDIGKDSDLYETVDIDEEESDDSLDVKEEEINEDSFDFDEIIDELTDDSDSHLNDDGDENEYEDTPGSDKDNSEDVQYTEQELEEKLQEEDEKEIDEGSLSSKVKFASSISKGVGGSILSSIRNKFSRNHDDNLDEVDDEEISDLIKDKLDEDEFIYVDHSDDEESSETENLTDDNDSFNVGDDTNTSTDSIGEDIADDSVVEDDLESVESDVDDSVVDDIVEPESVGSDVDDSVVEDDLESVGSDVDDSVVEDDLESVGSDVDDSVVDDIVEPESVGSDVDDSVVVDIVEPEPVKKEYKPKNNVNFNKSTDGIDREDISQVNEKEDSTLDLEENIEENFEVKSDKEFNDVVSEDKVDLDVDDSSDDVKVDLGSDEDYIYVDHSNDEESIIDYSEDKSDLDVDDVKVDLGSDDDSSDDVKVDLGSDEDYIYVDHSNDEESTIDSSDDENEPPVVEVNPLKNILFGDRKPNNPNGLSESKISNAIRGSSRLNLTKEEVETVHGEIIDEDINDYKPAPSDDDVVEVEILSGDIKNVEQNNDDISNNDDLKVVFKRNVDGVSGMRRNKPVKEKEFNRIIDEAFENNPEGSLGDEDISNLASALVNKAFDDVISDTLNNKDDENTQKFEANDNNNQPTVEDNYINVNDSQNVNNTSTSPDGITYYKGINDVNSPLRKNNLYYDEDKHKNKSVKDSIKSGIRDIKYIRKSLNEIENPTQVGYVSVVDRTEEYDENDYLTPIQDYEGEEYVPQDEGLTFAEEEELRYERELQMEKLKQELSSDDDAIVTIHEQERREDRKDQALEDIIQIADEDYKEIEKERFKSNNTLKAFDDNKLPKRGKIEDEIVNYKFASDFGLNSQDDLYSQPIDNVSNSINKIVNVEGPIHINEVIKRVKDSCHIKRAGSKMKKQVLRGIKESENSGNIIRIGDFLYDASSNDVVIRRREKPKIELISDEEIAKNIEIILSHKQSVTTASLTREVARNFGFKSTSRKTSSKIKSVLDSMIADSTVKLDNDIVELN